MLSLDRDLIAGLRALLDDLQYDAVQRTLRANYFVRPFPALEAFQKLTLNLPERQRVSYEVLLLGQPIRRERLEALWGAGLVRSLLDLGLLEPADNLRLRTANCSIVSYAGRYFVVTLNPSYPGSRDPDATVYMGADSLTLAGHLLGPDGTRRFRRALDLCAGSGIQAILAASFADEVQAVELNPQAAHVARFNALLNGVEDRVTVEEGNLFDAAPAGAYDLVVSNPPFIPVPAGVPFAMCGAGGEDGLVVLRPLLEGLPARLAEDGLAIIYAEGVGDAEGPFVRRLLTDQTGVEHLDVRMVVTSRLSVKGALVLRTLTLQKLKRNVPIELAQWRDLYPRQDATHVFNYVLRIRRGSGRLTQFMAFDPHLEDRGFEIQPGVLIRPQ